jgi:hypothetical protein
MQTPRFFLVCVLKPTPVLHTGLIKAAAGLPSRLAAEMVTQGQRNPASAGPVTTLQTHTQFLKQLKPKRGNVHTALSPNHTHSLVMSIQVKSAERKRAADWWDWFI